MSPSQYRPHHRVTTKPPKGPHPTNLVLVPFGNATTRSPTSPGHHQADTYTPARDEGGSEFVVDEVSGGWQYRIIEMEKKGPRTGVNFVHCSVDCQSLYQSMPRSRFSYATALDGFHCPISIEPLLLVRWVHYFYQSSSATPFPASGSPIAGYNLCL